MSDRRVAAWVWIVFAVGTLGAWWPLLDERVWSAARHSSELLQPEEWRALATRLPESSASDPPLFVRAGSSAAFVWMRFLAYPQRVAAVPRSLEVEALRRVLPAETIWMLLLHAGDARGVLRQLSTRTAPRVPIARAQHADHVLVELPP